MAFSATSILRGSSPTRAKKERKKERKKAIIIDILSSKSRKLRWTSSILSANNMTTPTSKIVAIIASTIVIISVLLISCSSNRIARWLSERYLYFKDFSKLSKEAEALAAETVEIKKAIIEDTTDRASLASISEADDWDNSIRIGLTTWRDLIWPEGDSGSDGEIRSWRKSNAPDVVKERKRMIGVMRARCKEGLSLRKALRPQLQRIHLGLIAWSDLNIRAAYTIGASADLVLANRIWTTAGQAASWCNPTMRWIRGCVMGAFEMGLKMKLTMNRLKDMDACRLISHSALLTTGDLPYPFARPWGLSHLHLLEQ
jgi:hypothetical protein